MPALPSVPNVLRLDLIHNWGDDPHLANRSFWKYSGGAPGNGDCSAFASLAETAWVGHISGLAGTFITLTGIRVTDLSSPTGGTAEISVSHSGARGGAALSINDCAVLNFPIARRYRGGKPRMYVPWGVDGDIAAGSNSWTSAFISAATTAWEDFQSAFSATEGSTTITNQCNISYYHGFASVQNPITLRWKNLPTPRAAAVDDAIVAVACSPFVGSQRRRVRAT